MLQFYPLLFLNGIRLASLPLKLKYYFLHSVGGVQNKQTSFYKLFLIITKLSFRLYVQSVAGVYKL